MKYAIVFTLLAATLLLNAWWSETWWCTVPLAWSGVAFALVALAYLVNAVWLFGKRSDGRVRWLSTIILLPYRLLAELIWWLNTRLSSEAPWHQIDARLVVGRRLAARDGMPPGIVSVLDLTCEFAEAQRLRSQDYRCLPMLDASHADPRTIARTVREVATKAETVYVHCAQGHGRTGLIAALILVAREPGLSPGDALARLQAIRPGIGLSRSQTQALEKVARILAET